MSFSVVLFYLLATLTAVSAIGVVVTQNIVRAATWLLFALSGTAGIFFLLGADFIGARLAGRVEREAFVGGFHRYWIRCDDTELCAKVPSSARHSVFAVGDEVAVVIHAKDLLLMLD